MGFLFPWPVALMMIMVMLKFDAVQGKQDFVNTKNSVFSLEERNLLVLGKILHTLEKLSDPKTKCNKDDEINEKLLALISTVDNTQKSVKIIADAAKKSSEDTSAKFETILTTIQNSQNNVKVYAKTTADAITKLQLADIEHIPTTSHTEMNVGTTTPIPTQPTVNSDLCESPYFLVGEECFHTSSDQKDWTSAKLQCQFEGGNLAAPKNLDDLRQNLLESGDEDDYWIGAHDIDGTWKWITGDPVEDEWQTDEPSGRYNEDCLDFRVGSRWPALGDYYCQRTQRYICERPFTGTVPPTPKQSVCSHVGAIKVGQMCLIISENELNWLDAATACTNKGGQLVSLQNERDPQMIHDHIFSNHRGRRFWLGGSDIDNEGQWVWMNGEPIENNFPWRYPQPDDFQGNEDCLEWASGGWGAHFNDAPCHVPFRYICELDSSSTEESTFETSSSTEVPTFETSSSTEVPTFETSLSTEVPTFETEALTTIQDLGTEIPLDGAQHDQPIWQYQSRHRRRSMWSQRKHNSCLKTCIQEGNLHPLQCNTLC